MGPFESNLIRIAVRIIIGSKISKKILNKISISRLNFSLFEKIKNKIHNL